MHGVLVARGINCDKLCPLCKCSEESISHLLRDSVIARDFWKKLEPPPSLISTFSDSLKAWVKVNSTSRIVHKASVQWGTLFLFALWCLWKNRNKVVFENTTPNPNLHKICIHQAREYYFYVSKTSLPTLKVAIQVRWNKLAAGWFKLNPDGASFGNPGKAGGGGIIRNSHGHWVKGFSSSIGHTTSIIVEWWALRDGLTLAIQLGYQQLEIELDAKVIVDLINSNSFSNRVYTPFLHDCRMLLGQLQQVRVAHIFREANKCVDFFG